MPPTTSLAWRGCIAVLFFSSAWGGPLGAASDDGLVDAIVEDGWNELHIIARGHTLIHLLNGRVMAVFIDDDVQHRRPNGLIGVQVHQGPPMKIEYRSIRLKRW